MVESHAAGNEVEVVESGGGEDGGVWVVGFDEGPDVRVHEVGVVMSDGGGVVFFD